MEGDSPAQKIGCQDAEGEKPKEAGKVAQQQQASGEDKPAVCEASGDDSVRPKTFFTQPVPSDDQQVQELSSLLDSQLKLDLTGLENSSEESSPEGGILHSKDARLQAKDTIGKAELEQTFTNMYCYFKMLEALSDDNESDHHRFIKFIQQVEHKQSELVRVSKTLPECSNLAIDLGYNLVVTASYMNLMFAWDAGKRYVGNELNDITLTSARHILEFAHRTQPELVPNCVEELILVMQRFCLVTVVDQAGNLPNLTKGQKQVLSKITNLIEKIDADSDASLSTPSDLSSDDGSEVDGEIMSAQKFGQEAYDNAIHQGKSIELGETKNVNNNADDTELQGNESEELEGAKAGSVETNSKTHSTADMDDVIMFSKCNPFANIWKLYIDNRDLVSLFKINNSHHEECLHQLPDCFTILLNLESIAYSIICTCMGEEVDKSFEYFHLLQTLVSKQKLESDEKGLLEQIVSNFGNVEENVSDLLDICEEETEKAVAEVLSSSSSESDCSDASDQSPVGSE